MKKAQPEKTELEKRLEAEAEAETQEAAPGTGPEEQAPQEPAPPAIDVEALQKERDALADQLLRARAEFDNYRKRMAREAERIRQTAAEALLRDVLPVVDHLELALRHAEDHQGALGEGVSMVLRQFHDVLAKHGLEPIAARGEQFDPEIHEAVMQREAEDAPEGAVLEEFQRGYRLGQYVLRPARVVVATGSPEPAAPAPETDAGDESRTTDADPK
ncbi:MAG: nucleotide exchange factor GrpE [Candidatus Hydrogenedentes bacterium]|nr:nucleotide exchange factor GrpE [Candidatus Hydrogenedentota bacterium]